jgi:hypothetical protein
MFDDVERYDREMARLAAEAGAGSSTDSLPTALPRATPPLQSSPLAKAPPPVPPFQTSMPQCGWTCRARAMTPKASAARSPTLGGRRPFTSDRRPTSESPVLRKPHRPCRRRPLRCRHRHPRCGALHMETCITRTRGAMVQGVRGRRFEQDGHAVIAFRTSHRERRLERPCHVGRKFCRWLRPCRAVTVTSLATT